MKGITRWTTTWTKPTAGGITEEESMSSIWTYRRGVATSDRDVVGFDVEATDGHIGKIDETSNEVGNAHIVVDTGFWIFGKKRLIPAGVVQRFNVEDEKVYIGMTKDEVESAPDYDEQQRDYQDQYDTYYETFGQRADEERRIS